MKSYAVKENHIGSVVSEILQYKETDSILLLYYKDLPEILSYFFLSWIWSNPCFTFELIEHFYSQNKHKNKTITKLWIFFYNEVQHEVCKLKFGISKTKNFKYFLIKLICFNLIISMVATFAFCRILRNYFPSLI